MPDVSNEYYFFSNSCENQNADVNETIIKRNENKNETIVFRLKWTVKKSGDAKEDDAKNESFNLIGLQKIHKTSERRTTEVLIDVRSSIYSYLTWWLCTAHG